MKVRLVDDAGQAIAQGRDPAELKRAHGGEGRQSFARIRASDRAGDGASDLERDGLTRWDFGDLPEQIDLERAGIRLRGYPALVDQGDSVAIRVLDSPESAGLAQRDGLRRLLILALGPELRELRKGLQGLDRMRLQYAKAPAAPGSGSNSAAGAAGKVPAGARQGGAKATAKPGPQAREPDLADLLIALAIDLNFVEGQPPIRERAAFEARLAGRKGALKAQTKEVCDLASRILETYHGVRGRLSAISQVNWLDSVEDIRARLDRLVFRGFLLAVPYAHLKDYPRYLSAAQERTEKLAHTAGRDRQMMAELTPLETRWAERLAAACRAGRADPRLDEIRWMLEELQVSLFAQRLGTAYPVSPKRIESRWRELGL
jgi:ATP-dependent helicase HrpA